MAQLLTEKIALVTGAGSGIGQAIAVAYAKEGAKVIITDLDVSGCHQTLEKVKKVGGQGWVYELDVTDVASVQKLADQVQEEAGNIDILVNNAGVILREGIDSPNAHAVIRKVMDVNLLGVFNTIHAWLPALRKSRGCIVNISSGAAFLGQPRALGYSASKGAVKMLTQSMAADLGIDGIRVNAIAPGVIVTPMTDATRSDPQRLEKFMVRIPLGRLGEGHEIAGAAVFLASDLATYVTGITLPVDGGILAV